MLACLLAAVSSEADEFDAQGPPSPDAVASASNSAVQSALDDRVVVRFCECHRQGGHAP